MARGGGLDELAAERLNRVMKTNVYALFWLTQAVLLHLRNGSSIVNWASIQAYQPSTSLLDYAATKAAIINVTANLAADLGHQGIRVNAVAPGPIWTPLQPATQPGERLETSAGTLRRDGQGNRARSPCLRLPCLSFRRELCVGHRTGGDRPEAGLLTLAVRCRSPRSVRRPRTLLGLGGVAPHRQTEQLQSMQGRCLDDRVLVADFVTSAPGSHPSGLGGGELGPVARPAFGVGARLDDGHDV